APSSTASTSTGGAHSSSGRTLHDARSRPLPGARRRRLRRGRRRCRGRRDGRAGLVASRRAFRGLRAVHDGGIHRVEPDPERDPCRRLRHRRARHRAQLAGRGQRCARLCCRGPRARGVVAAGTGGPRRRRRRSCWAGGDGCRHLRAVRTRVTAETPDQDTERDPQPLRAFLRYFLGLGTWGFGGPIATVGYMQRDLVEDRNWLERQDFLDGVALGQTMPGPLAAQVSMWVGYLVSGAAGALAVAGAFILPSFVFVLGVAVLYVHYQGLSVVQSIF